MMMILIAGYLKFGIVFLFPPQSALDKFNKTALDYCESVDRPDWQAAATLLRVAMSQPVCALFIYKHAPLDSLLEIMRY